MLVANVPILQSSPPEPSKAVSKEGFPKYHMVWGRESLQSLPLPNEHSRTEGCSRWGQIFAPENHAFAWPCILGRRKGLALPGTRFIFQTLPYFKHSQQYVQTIDLIWSILLNCAWWEKPGNNRCDIKYKCQAPKAGAGTSLNTK